MVDRPITVALDAGYDTAQVFAPPDRDVVSLEPMAAPTDALRTGEGLALLGAGARFVMTSA